jgi:hypothetical protein
VVVEPIRVERQGEDFDLALRRAGVRISDVAEDRRRDHRRQGADHCDHDQHLDQRETTRIVPNPGAAISPE